MEENVLGGGSPLYDRRTGAIDLPPLSIDDARQFYPGDNPDTTIQSWDVFGGTPYYLRALDPSVTLEDNIHARILSEHGVLYNEPEFLLRTEFGIREPQTYYTILRAIATGNRETSEIANFASVIRTATGRTSRSSVDYGLSSALFPHGEAECDAKELVSTERTALPVLVPLRLRTDRKARPARRRGLQGTRRADVYGLYGPDVRDRLSERPPITAPKNGLRDWLLVVSRTRTRRSRAWKRRDTRRRRVQVHDTADD